jgi:diaminopimelate epimerase
MVAARLHGLVGPCVDIRLPGGTLRAQWHGGPGDLDYAVTLAGPAERTFVGTWFGA